MRRAHSHADEQTPRRRTQAEQVGDLPMFAVPSVAVETSERAADSVRAHVRAAHDIIVALLVVHGRLTCEEVRQRTGWDGDYARPRLWELEGQQVIRKCDGQHGADLVQRRTRTGRMATCYELTAIGQRHADAQSHAAQQRLEGGR